MATLTRTFSALDGAKLHKELLIAFPGNFLGFQTNAADETELIFHFTIALSAPEIVTFDALLTAYVDTAPPADLPGLDEKSAMQYTTGWIKGCQITINGGDSSLIDVTDGFVQFADYSDTTNVVSTILKVDAQVGIDPSLTTRTKWVAIKQDVNGDPEFVYQLGFDHTDLRTHAVIGKIRDNGGTGPNITNVDDFERPSWQLPQAFQDFILVHGSFNNQGNIYSANGGVTGDLPMQMDKSSGRSYRYGAGSDETDGNVHADPVQIPRTSYAYHVQGQNTTIGRTTIDPDQWDNAGTLTAVANNKWTVQTVFMFPVSGSCHIAYGQAEYGSKSDAMAAIDTESRVLNTEILDGSILRAFIIIKKGTTQLSVIGNVEIREAISGGAGGIGGAAMASVQVDPLLIFSDMSGTTVNEATNNDGTLKGNATFDAANDWVQLTPASASQVGQLEYNVNPGASFSTEFELRVGGGTGADATFFYAFCDSTPATETDAVGGYIIAFDEFDDQIQLQYNGSALTAASVTDLDNDEFRRIRIEFERNKFLIFLDGVLLIEYTDNVTPARDISGLLMGYGARTGGSTNYHRIRAINVYRSSGLSDNAGFDIVTADETITAKDVVTFSNTTDRRFKKTTVASDERVLGVAITGATIGNNFRMAVGREFEVVINGTVTRGDFLNSSVSAGRVESSGTGGSPGDFAIAMESGTIGQTITARFKKAEVF